MLDLLYQGGILFMGILTLILLAVCSVAILLGLQIVTGKQEDLEKRRHQLSYVKSLGIFAFMFGLLGQALGLYQAFVAIEKMEQVTPALLASGLRVTSITAIYGTLIFLLSYLLWFGLEVLLNRQPSP